MESNFNLKRELNNLHITVSVKPKFYAYLLFLITLILFFTPFLFPFNGGIEEIFGIIIYFVLVFLFPLKYSIWNIFGKEDLVINKKSISYRYNYGFISNNLKTKTYSNLIISFQDFLIDENERFGKVYFYEEDEETGLIKLVHNTSIYISEVNFNTISSEIEKAFRFDTFSMN